MAMPNIPNFPVSSDPNTASTRWDKWLRRFESAMLGFNIKDDTRKRALLLHFAGDEVEDIFQTLANTGEEKDYKKAKDALTDYFTPKKNKIYETVIFRRTHQNPGESIDTYVTRLREIAVHCEFADLERELLTQIIDGGRSRALRQKAM